MAVKKIQFKASLIKYRQADMKEAIWFWVNPNTGTTLSPEFSTQVDAEKWFDDVLLVHQETYDLMERTKFGKFFTVKGKVDIGDIISSKKAGDCPFDMRIDGDVLSVKVLALDEESARKRVEEYIEILEWLNERKN